MKGIVFNLFEEAVTTAHDEVYWDALLGDAGLPGAYTSLGSYPDADFARLAGAYAVRRGWQAEAVLRWFGQHMIKSFSKRMPGLFRSHAGLRPFLLSLNTLIHPEVRKLYPDAAVPEFEFEEPTHDKLVILYRSERRLCALAEGLIAGAAEHYHATIKLAHPECMHRGCVACRLEVQFQQ